MKYLLMIVFIPISVMAQYPGYFYTFKLTDTNGKTINLKDNDYKMMPVRRANSRVLLQIDMCRDDPAILHFYEGYKDFDTIQQLQITKLNSKPKEIMIIEFPPTLSIGQEPFYHNLYVGNLIFRKGIYKVKLPSTAKEWDGLLIKHLCPDYGGVDTFYDVSILQDESK
jgi:hypothetical protein